MIESRPARRWIVLCLTLLGLAVSGPVPALEVPYLAGRVNDLAGMIDEAARARIDEKLAALERATGAQVAVLTVESLEGDPLEDFSMRVVETWGLGREEQDDGVLLLVAKNDRKMRIEVGYGAEGRLTDAQSGRILNNLLRPAFRAGRFSEGIEGGVDAIVGALQGDLEAIPLESPAGGGEMSDLSPVGRTVSLLFFLGMIGIFAFSAVASPGCAGWFLWVFLMPFMGLFPAALVHPWAGMALLGAWIVGFPLIRLWLGRTTGGRAFKKRYPIFVSTGGWGGSSGSGWSGGGFSGGGGSFGGGGASSSW